MVIVLKVVAPLLLPTCTNVMTLINAYLIERARVVNEIGNSC